MNDQNIAPITLTQIDAKPAAVDQPDLLDEVRAALSNSKAAQRVASPFRRIHKWASPAWRDLPSLLRTLRDGSMLLGIWLFLAGIAALTAVITTTVGNMGGSPGSSYWG